MFEGKPYFYGTAEERVLLPVLEYIRVQVKSLSTKEILMITLALKP